MGGFITPAPPPLPDDTTTDSSYVYGDLGELAKLHSNRFRLTVLIFLVEPALFVIVWGFISTVLWVGMFGLTARYDRNAEPEVRQIILTLILVPACAALVWLVQLVRLFFLLRKHDCES